VLLLEDRHLDERRAAAGGPLAPLADSLASDLEPLLDRDPYVPAGKALLSRAGGRCERDGAPLEFDPFSPHAHRCPRCGKVYAGEWHDRWWLYPYQLWLAERAVQGALLWLLRGDARHAQMARTILERYAQQYVRYPNSDNVLGPARVFFSTYLESIWLLQVCIAIDLLEAGGDFSLGAIVRDQVVSPAAGLIAEYDEGMSNRQAWNNAALLAASRLLDRDGTFEDRLFGRSGVAMLTRDGLLSDATWYEGENYHFFAHRGLWYCATMAETAGVYLDPALTARVNRAFAAGFATALPDFTFPARKDSQYAVSLRQWRFAEYAELGLARAERAADGALARDLRATLARMYDERSLQVSSEHGAMNEAGDAPMHPLAQRADSSRTQRARSTADVERNEPAVSLTRADLGWRALLHATVELPELWLSSPRSVHLEGQGYTVFRRDAGNVYVALDWGQSGGGHGHPDRLNVVFAQGATRWLDDLGTGSYVDRSLHWYRSTLAHNAPLVDGRSQMRTDGRLLAYDERGGFGWILSAVDELAPDVRAERALIVAPGYFVDELRWTAMRDVQFDLPIHFDGAAGMAFAPSHLTGGDGLEDGFDFVEGAEVAHVEAMHTVRLLASRGDARVWLCSSEGVRLFRARAPGQPGSEMQLFHVARCVGQRGVIRSVYAWSQEVTDVRFADERVEVDVRGELHEHWRTPGFWQVELQSGHAHSGIELMGWTAAPTHAEAHVRARDSAAEALPSNTQVHILAPGERATIALGSSAYRRSEDSWEDAGRPTGTITLARPHGHVTRALPSHALAPARELIVDVVAHTGPIVYVDDDAVNPYDNEYPDINGDGVQIRLATPHAVCAWLVTPVRERNEARVRPLAQCGANDDITLERALWREEHDGFSMHLRFTFSQTRSPRPQTEGLPVQLALAINETVPGRVRRRGQLVIGRGAGDFVYLRGDRFELSEGVRLLLVE
jgi:hypothetical protein